MKRYFIFIILINMPFSAIYTQQLSSHKSEVSFHFPVKMENIRATNPKSKSTFKISNGKVSTSLTLSDFEFEEALVKKHLFQYVLNIKAYPQILFDGYIMNIHTIDFSKNGEYNIDLQGKLNVNGKVKKITAIGTLTKKGKSIYVLVKFDVFLKDFELKLPKKAQEIAQHLPIHIKVDALFFL